IIDDNGQPLSGVTVREIGHENQSYTDASGKFSLSLQGTDALLRFSLVGYYPKEEAVGSSDNVTVRLMVEVQEVDEVVVVGYGTQKKENLTGATTVVDSKLLQSRPAANVS